MSSPSQGSTQKLLTCYQLHIYNIAIESAQNGNKLNTYSRLNIVEGRLIEKSILQER